MVRVIGKWLGRLLWLVVIAVALFLIFAPGYVVRTRDAVAPHDPYPVSDAAATLHAGLTIGDWHADSLLWNRDLNERGNRGQVDIPRLLEGNSGWGCGTPQMMLGGMLRTRV